MNQLPVDGNWLPGEAVAPQKYEAPAERKSVCDQTVDSLASIQRDEEFIDKRSDAQVSIQLFIDTNRSFLQECFLNIITCEA